MIRRVAVLCILWFFSPSHSWSQTNAELLKEIKAIRQELADIKRLLGAPKPAADALPRDPININNEPLKGDKNAKVVLIEYSDYQCPFCSKFVNDTYPEIQTAYIKTGKVKHVFRD